MLVFGAIHTSIELYSNNQQSVKIPIGILELEIGISPFSPKTENEKILIPSKIIEKQFQSEKIVRTEKFRHFYNYVTKWWEDFIQIYPEKRILEQRCLELFPENEFGEKCFVTMFIRPIYVAEFVINSFFRYNRWFQPKNVTERRRIRKKSRVCCRSKNFLLVNFCATKQPKIPRCELLFLGFFQLHPTLSDLFN